MHMWGTWHAIRTITRIPIHHAISTITCTYSHHAFNHHAVPTTTTTTHIPNNHTQTKKMPHDYKLYRVQERIPLPDPDMPQPRYHNILFLETSPSTGHGTNYQVTSDLVTGMTYTSSPCSRPEDSPSLYAREFLGLVAAKHYPEEIERVLKGIPPPGKQKAFNASTMRTEQVKPDGTFYGPGEFRPPMIKCTEWTIERAIPALRIAGILC